MLSKSNNNTNTNNGGTNPFRRSVQQMNTLHTYDEITRKIDQAKVINCILAALGSATSIAAAENVYMQDGDSSSISNILKILTTILSIFLIIGVSYRYRLEFSLRQLNGTLLPSEGFFDTNLRNNFIMELFICMIHSPAGVYYKFGVTNLGLHITYDLDSVLSVFALLRLYAFVQLFSDSYGLRSAHARVVEKYNKVSFNTSFGFRAILDRHPIRTVLAFFGLSTILFAYALRVFERPVCHTNEAVLAGWCSETTLGIKDYEHFAVAVWNILITETTIGYGDVVAVTHAGRVVIGISALTGIVLIALFVTAVSNYSQFKPDERRAFDAFLRHKYALQRRLLAKHMIQYFLLFAIYIRRHNRSSGMGQTLKNFTSNFTSKSSSSSVNNITNPLHNHPTNSTIRNHTGIVPRSIIRGLIYSIGRWREHQREWHELTRDKDDIGILQRDIIEITSRITENNGQVCAEIDRLTLHNMALSKQLELLTTSTLPGTLAQLEAISNQLKIPLHSNFLIAQNKVQEFQKYPPPPISLELSADLLEYERRQREMAKIIEFRKNTEISNNNSPNKTNKLHSPTNTTKNPLSYNHVWPSARTVILGIDDKRKDTARLNGRPLHSRVSNIFR